MFVFVCMCAHRKRVREALVAMGLLPHVNLYFLMSRCSRGVEHAEKQAVEFEHVWGGVGGG